MTNYRGGKRTVTLLTRSRGLRRNATDAERLLWQRLRGGQIVGAKFRRQHEYGPYILDFYCAERHLAIEADGGQHFSAEGSRYDAERTRYLASRGVRVLRFTNLEILNPIDAVLEVIQQALGENPHPNPLPEGEGT